MATYHSQRQFAQAIGVAPSTITKNMKRGDLPAGLPRRAPWTDEHVSIYKTWMLNLQDDRSGKGRGAQPVGTGGGTSVAERRAIAEVVLKQQKARIEKVKADLAEGSVIPIDQHERSLIGLAHMFVAALEELEQGIPHDLDGDPARNESVLRNWVNECRQRLLATARIKLADTEHVGQVKRGAF